MGFDGNAAAKSFGGGRRASAGPCDNCRSAAATVFCEGGAAFLCRAYDKLTSCHNRAWMCEACERTRAAFACRRADYLLNPYSPSY